MADQLNGRPRSSRSNFRRGRALAVVALALALPSAFARSALAASPVPLGTADSFALLAGSTITNIGSTSISGDIGLCCTGRATTGFGPGANQVNQPAGALYVGSAYRVSSIRVVS